MAAGLRVFLVAVLGMFAASAVRIETKINLDNPAKTRAAAVGDGGTASAAVTKADPLIEKGDMTAALAAFEGIDEKLADELGDLLSAQHNKTPLSVYRNPVAKVNGELFEPTVNHIHGYHGNKAKPEDVFEHGFPAKGPSIDLVIQALDGEGRAFRGTCDFIFSPDRESGPGQFAGEGGFVYEIDGVPGWDVNKLLEGRVANAVTGYGGSPFTSEVETTILGHVPSSRIRGVYTIRTSRGLHLIPGRRTDNPNYVPLKAL